MKFTLIIQLYPGTWREYWYMYRHNTVRETRLRICKPDGIQWKAPTVFNLIYRNEMPVTIGVFDTGPCDGRQRIKYTKPLQPQF